MMPKFPVLPLRTEKFTLLELLIVIAILAVLAGLLLPALQNARSRGCSAGCMGNLRQIGIAHASYFEDYQDYIPSTFKTTDTTYIAAWCEGGTEHLKHGSGVFLQRYLRATASNNWKKEKSILDDPGRAEPYTSGYYTSYAYNDSIGSRAEAHNWQNTKHISSPTRLIQFMDARTDVGSGYRSDLIDGWYSQPYSYEFTETGEPKGSYSRNNMILRHLGYANILLLDGHAAGIRGPSPYEFWKSGSPLYSTRNIY